MEILSADLLHYPKLSKLDFGLFRSPGSGLGNLLFPLARALIGSEIRGGRFVYPTMRQIKLGPLLRRERDLRTYGDVLRPRRVPEWLDWVKAGTRLKVREDEYLDQSGVSIVYEGLGRQFHDIFEHRELVSDFLVHNMRGSRDSEYQPDIAIHIRRGDFFSPRLGASDQNYQIPTEWYRDAYAEACRIVGLRHPRVILFTDGDFEALRAELRLPHAEPEPKRNALTSILAIADARVLIGSQSTFSLWGAFLGNGYAIWPSGYDLKKYIPARNGVDLVV